LRRALALLAAAGAIGATGVMLAFDPDQPLAVAAAVGLLAVLAGALVGLFQPRRGGRSRGRADPRIPRRAAGVALIVALLLTLRVADALTLITGGFIVGAFVAAEIILSARPSSR
jgi:hypothetical protein